MRRSVAAPARRIARSCASSASGEREEQRDPALGGAARGTAGSCRRRSRGRAPSPAGPPAARGSAPARGGARPRSASAGRRGSSAPCAPARRPRRRRPAPPRPPRRLATFGEHGDPAAVAGDGVERRARAAARAALRRRAAAASRAAATRTGSGSRIASPRWPSTTISPVAPQDRRPRAGDHRHAERAGDDRRVGGVRRRGEGERAHAPGELDDVGRPGVGGDDDGVRRRLGDDPPARRRSARRPTLRTSSARAASISSSMRGEQRRRPLDRGGDRGPGRAARGRPPPRRRRCERGVARHQRAGRDDLRPPRPRAAAARASSSAAAASSAASACVRPDRRSVVTGEGVAGATRGRPPCRARPGGRASTRSAISPRRRRRARAPAGSRRRRWRRGPGGRSSARRGTRPARGAPASGSSPSRPPPRRPRRRAPRGDELRLDRRSSGGRAGRSASSIVLSPAAAAPRSATAVVRGVEGVGEVARVNASRVAERTARPAERRAPQRPARPAHGRDERLAGEDEDPPRRQAVLGRLERGRDRREPAVHVRPVVAVADGGVELREVVPLGADRAGGLGEPGGDGGGVHGALGDHCS